MDFKKSVEGHLTYLRKLKDYTEERLEKMPEGSLRRKKTREKMYYYLKSGHQEFSLLKYPGLRDIYIEKEWLQGRLKASPAYATSTSSRWFACIRRIRPILSRLPFTELNAVTPV